MRIRDASRRYANALMELAKQKGTQKEALQQLGAVSDAFAVEPSIQAYFVNPTISPEQKMTLLKGALQGQNLLEEVSNTLLLLVEKGRLDSLAEMVASFRNAMDREDGVTRGTVSSAKPLDASARQAIEAKINKVLNKKIILTYSEDPKLLGGVVAQVGGWTFDDSIDAQLKKLNEDLNRRTN